METNKRKNLTTQVLKWSSIALGISICVLIGVLLAAPDPAAYMGFILALILAVFISFTVAAISAIWTLIHFVIKRNPQLSPMTTPKKVGITFLSMMAVGGILDLFAQETTASQRPGIIVSIALAIGLIIYLVVKKPKHTSSPDVPAPAPEVHVNTSVNASDSPTPNIEKKSRPYKGINTKFRHIDGLPVPESAVCKVCSHEDSIEIVSGSTTMTLNRNKITDMNIMTAAEVQKQAVSSVGGAVAGAVFFGPLGAIIGGRTKTKEIKSSTKCLIITYQGSQNELKYIAFNANQNSLDAHSLVKEFKKLDHAEGIKIEL